MAFIKNFCISFLLCFRKLSFKVVSFALIVVSVFIVGLFSVQLMLNQPLIQKKLSQKLSDWSGGDLSFSGAIQISYFPQVSLKAEHVFLRDVRRLPHIDKMRARSVTANFEWWPLLIGRLNVGELRLDEPEIYLSKFDILTESAKQVEKLEKQYFKRILKTVQNIPFTEMHFDNALLVVPNKIETGRDLYKFTAHLSKEGYEGKFSGRGYFELRGKTIHIAGFSAATQNSLSEGVIPLDVTFNNALFKSRFAGTLNIGAEKKFVGKADIRDFKSQEVANWFGVSVKESARLSEIDLSGDFEWNKKQFSFKKAHFLSGAHRASGRIFVRYDKPRPHISGNLLFAELNVKSQTKGKSFLEDALFSLQGTAQDNKREIAEGQQSSEKTFISLCDADMRFSVRELKVDDTTLRAVVGTLLIRDGNPEFHLADAQVFEGRAYGYLKQTVVNQRVQHQLDLNFKNIQSEKLVAVLSDKAVLDGRSDIHLYLTGMGNDRAEVLSNIDGKVILVSASTGHVGLDFAQLFKHKVTVARGKTLKIKTNLKNEWLGILNKKTPFEHMTAKLVFQKGMLKSNRVRINENGYLISILGQANLARKQIKWLFDRKIVKDVMTESMKTITYGIEATRRVVTLVEGALENPSIKRHYIAINAALVDMKLFPDANQGRNLAINQTGMSD